MYKLYLKFDLLPKSLNKKLGANWRTRHKENKSWDLMIACECSSKLPKYPLDKAQVSIVRHSHRMLDYDGLVGSMKPVVDALVSCGVLKDDSWNVLGAWVVTQRFRSKKEGQLLEVMVIGKPENIIDN